MGIAEFNDLKFVVQKDLVKVIFLDNYHFNCDLFEFDERQLKISSNSLSSNGTDKEVRDRFNPILDAGFNNLINSITGKQTAYVNKFFGLPLIGSAAFGIVDRNSSMIEIKPVTGCNMNCVFCSVDEGLSTKKTSEILIDKDYLVEEAVTLISTKPKPVQLVINAHGEPTLYKPLAQLIEGLNIKGVSSISLITNGTLLTNQLIDTYVKSGLTRLNLSLNAISDKAAKILEGHGKYDVNHVKEIAKYAADKLELVLAPVFVPGISDTELPLIVKFAKQIKAKVGAQNYLYYAKGRNPKTNQMPWDNFYSMLKNLEKRYDIKLILDESDFEVRKTPSLVKPFRRGQNVTAVIKCLGRYPNEQIAASSTRNITLIGSSGRIGQKVKVKLTGDKHNIFFGQVI